jgi:hypothetical protein
MRTLATVLALALSCACAASYSSGDNHLNDSDSGAVGNPNPIVDGGDGGSDGGDDAGPDAGCVPRSLTGVGAIDNCTGSVSAVADVVVAGPSQGCAVSISLNTAMTPCTGVAGRGSLDAFDGGCAGSAFTCTSPSLPGTLTCVGGPQPCTIRICDAGVCGP